MFGSIRLAHEKQPADLRKMLLRLCPRSPCFRTTDGQTTICLIYSSWANCRLLACVHQITNAKPIRQTAAMPGRSFVARSPDVSRPCHRVRPKVSSSSWSTAAAALRGDLDLGEDIKRRRSSEAAPPGLYECCFSTTRWLLSTTVSCHLASPFHQDHRHDNAERRRPPSFQQP